jgi:hypothetical protein
MKKLIHITIIVLFIIGICLTEQLLSDKYFNEVRERTANLSALLSVSQNLNENDIPYYTDELFTYWSQKESVLCTFVNHKEIDDIGVELNKMKTSLSNNDKEKYEESLNLIKYYVKSYEHVIGINFQNIF